ncbi:hypothetical protein BH10BAC2_BH10BAC2_40340 [soil metagenome]
MPKTHKCATQQPMPKRTKAGTKRTILLFYKIPATLELKNFNDSILFYVIPVTSFIMMPGMFFYKKKDKDIVSDELLTN